MTHYTAHDLALAEQHIVEGEERIVRQEALVTNLRVDGRSSTDAEELLAVLKITLSEFYHHRAAIAEALDAKAASETRPT